MIPDPELESAIPLANIPVLLMVLHQVTGEHRWLEDPFRPTRPKGLGDHDSGGLDESLQEEVRRASVPAIRHLLEGRPPRIAAPSAAVMSRMLSACMGERIDKRYGEMLGAELRRRTSSTGPSAGGEGVAAGGSTPSKDFTVLVIGGGPAGTIALNELTSMGVATVVVEAQAGPGGVWRQNTYPGAGVDTPSHLYSFSFAASDWSQHFAMRDELQQYFDSTLHKLSRSSRVYYGTRVRSIEYDADRSKWSATLHRPDGSVEHVETDAVVSAVGALNRPVVPPVPGLDRFAGPTFHSSQWPTGLDVTGTDVVLVGSGASAMQIAPAIASRVRSLTILQRSPQWAAPFEKFHQPIPEQLRELLATVPLYRAWYWMRLFWQFGDNVISSLRIDPGWEHPERSVNSRNDGHREFFTSYIQSIMGESHPLLGVVVPEYPPFGKRILLDNGWYETLLRPNVDLVPQRVASVTRDAVLDATGASHRADVLIWATGFDTALFLSSFEVIGLDGRELRDVWHDDDPRAYRGVSVPGFPNLFILGGPNSFPGSGSFMFVMEMQMRYIRRLITAMRGADVKAIDARADATTDYNLRVDEGHRHAVWSHPGMSTYYRNAHGRVVFLMPFLNIEYWKMTREADLENYTLRV